MPWKPALKAPVSVIEQASAPQHWRGVCRNRWIWESILWTSLERHKETMDGFMGFRAWRNQSGNQIWFLT